MVERNITRNVISREDHEQNVLDLPDDSANAEWISVESLAEDGSDGDSGSNNGSRSS